MANPKDKTKPAEREPMLTVSTLSPERPIVVIDDETYELRLMQDFGSIEHQQFTQRSSEYDALWGREKLSVKDGKRMEWLLDWLFDHVLVAEAVVTIRERLGAKLSGAIKREIVLTFTNAPLLMAVMAQQTEIKPEDGPSTTGS